MKTTIVFVALFFCASHVFAEIAGVENVHRAQLDYMLNCQGCHGPTGAGTLDGSVPKMENFVGHFLSVPDGREYLIRVPGSANAPLSDNRLAEVLNWMLWRISSDELPADFLPYTESEVGKWRKEPLQDVVEHRATLIERINSSNVIAN